MNEFDEKAAIDEFNHKLTPDNGHDLSALERLEQSRWVQGARWQFDQLQARETALLKEIEELKADLVTLEAQFQLVDEAHERCVIARDEYKAKLAASEAEVERRRLLTLEMSE